MAALNPTRLAQWKLGSWNTQLKTTLINFFAWVFVIASYHREFIRAYVLISNVDIMPETKNIINQY